MLRTSEFAPNTRFYQGKVERDNKTSMTWKFLDRMSVSE